MGEINCIQTYLQGLKVIEPRVFGDERGFFLESYSLKDFSNIGIRETFVQDNHSKSSKGVLRGLHLQTKHVQDKLVRVISGRIFDVAVDLRENSPTYSRWFGTELSEQNKKMLFIPKGFAHGFLSLEDDTQVLYKVTDYYDAQSELGIIYNDPTIAIEWPIENMDVILSAKDSKYPTLETYEKQLEQLKNI